MKMKMEMKVGVLHAKGNFLKVWSSKKKVCGKKVVVFSLALDKIKQISLTYHLKSLIAGI
jgi:hypothetical protein